MMSEEKGTLFTFMNGCAVNRDMFYITAVPDEVLEENDGDYSVMFIYQNKAVWQDEEQPRDRWYYHELPHWDVTSTCFPEPLEGKKRKVYALNVDGKVECYSKEGSENVEIVADARYKEDRPRHRLFNRIRKLGEHLYVCGHGCQVYRRMENGWEHHDVGLLQESTPFRPALGSTEEEQQKTILNLSTATEEEQLEIFRRMFAAMGDRLISIYDINGPTEYDLYAVGDDGFIAHHDGGGWNRLARMTAARLHCIHIISPSELWIVGSNGTILRGNARDGFDVIARKTMRWSFLSITSYQEIIYISADNGIYTIRNEIPEKLEISDQLGLRNVSHIEAKDGVLWALSPKKLVRFDGNQWECFVHPNNQSDDGE